MTGLGRSVGTQARIVYTVATRDMQLKHRESPIGVLSALIEPLMTISIMTLAFTYIRLRAPNMGDFLMLFLMTGILPVTMFRTAANGGERAFVKMRRALALPQLRPLDLLMGGAAANLVVVLLLFVGITLFFKVIYRTEEPGNLMLALIPCICNGVIGLGIGSLNLTIKSWFPFWGTIFSIATTPLGIASGLFYHAEMVPPKVQDILYYNPFFHSTELCRTFFFPEYTSTFFDPYYYGGWVIGALALGLACERTFRYRLGIGKA
jgi:capsular polysaccharide transport system permease protein